MFTVFTSLHITPYEQKNVATADKSDVPLSHWLDRVSSLL